jgi:hypothetical protein
MSLNMHEYNKLKNISIEIQEITAFLLEYYLNKNTENVFLFNMKNNLNLKNVYDKIILKQIEQIENFDIFRLEKMLLHNEPNIKTNVDVIMQIAITFCIINYMRCKYCNTHK